jgi:hypothetical protein
MRAFTPFPLAALPPFLPISRITLETRSLLMALFYDGRTSSTNGEVDSGSRPWHNSYAHSAMSIKKTGAGAENLEERSALVLEHVCAPNHHHLIGGNDG